MLQIRNIDKLPFFILLTTLLLFSCSSPLKVKIIDEEKAPLNEEINFPEETNNNLEELRENQQLNEEITEDRIIFLIDKGKLTDNYGYSFYGKKVGDRGVLIQLPGYAVLSKGHKVKKYFSEPRKLENGKLYNEVYLDTKEMKAFAICSSEKCPGLKEVDEINYEHEALQFTPINLLEDISSNLRKVGTKLLNSRKTTIVEFTPKEGYIEALTLDDFSGVPLEMKLYRLDDDKRVLEEEYLFKNLRVNYLFNEDVELPEGYKENVPKIFLDVAEVEIFDGYLRNIIVTVKNTRSLPIEPLVGIHIYRSGAFICADTEEIPGTHTLATSEQITATIEFQPCRLPGSGTYILKTILKDKYNKKFNTHTQEITYKVN